jgi:hypothetical protein
MKKLLITLGIVLIMVTVFAVPALAADPPLSLGQVISDQNATGDPGVMADTVASVKALFPDTPFGQVLKEAKTNFGWIPGKNK